MREKRVDEIQVSMFWRFLLQRNSDANFQTSFENGTRKSRCICGFECQKEFSENQWNVPRTVNRIYK
jgi:hypothetical protein